MAGTVTHSVVQQFASMKPTEFGPTIEPKWQVGERLLKEVKASVEKGYLTPLDGARVISSITATLFGYDEFILREISPDVARLGAGAAPLNRRRGRSALLPLRTCSFGAETSDPEARNAVLDIPRPGGEPRVLEDCPDELPELRATLVRIKSGARAKGLAQPLAT